MKVGITINDTIRLHKDYVAAIFASTADSNDNSPQYDLTHYNEGEHGDFNRLSEEEKKKWEIKEGDNTPVKLSLRDDNFSLSHLENFFLPSKKEFNAFMYQNMAYQIFGRAQTVYEEVMMDLNEIYNILTGEDGVEVELISQERHNSKPSTLLFLSTHNCRLNTIKFYGHYENIWSKYDVLITANPYILSIKPKDKVCFFIGECEHKDDRTLVFEDLSHYYEYLREQVTN